MTDNEIIKALDSVGTATGVALGHHSGQADIIADRFRELIDENNRQKAEIERLQKHNSVVARKHYDDGIKEFAERLKEEIRCEDDCGYHCYGCCYECKDYVIAVDNLVNEMTEVN